MVIYGTALLAVCVLLGLLLGEALGLLIGVKANVGGVGFAMLLLMFSSEWLKQRGLLPAPTQQGIAFWSAIYVPIVVAMAAQQNVAAALKGGPAALLAGVLAVVVCGALIPVLDRLGKKPHPPLEEAHHEPANG